MRCPNCGTERVGNGIYCTQCEYTFPPTPGASPHYPPEYRHVREAVVNERVYYTPPVKPDQTKFWLFVVITIIIIAVVIVAAIALMLPSKDADWSYTNLHKHDAGFWTEIDGTLKNTGNADAYRVEVQVYAVAHGSKYYGTHYVGDVPAGGAKDFWVLIDVDYADVTSIGVGDVTWYRS